MPVRPSPSSPRPVVKHSTNLFPFVILLLVIGCTPRHPVEEISVGKDAVDLSDPPVIEPGDWNAWRGPTQMGVADDQPVATTWNDSTNIRWKSEIPGRGHGSPIVVGTSVFVLTAVDPQEQQWVLALDRSDGHEKWRELIHEGGFPSGRSIHPKGSHANGTIACDGTRLLTAVLNSDSIIATALDLDGNTLWQTEIGKFVSKFGYAPSPAIYRSLVIFAADNMGGGYLAALDRKSGSIVWRVARGNDSSYSSPMVATIGDREQLVISGGKAVVSYDPATGEQLWRTECLAEATCGTLVTDGSRIFASGGYPQSETVGLSADGSILWSNSTKLYEPSLLVVGDAVVGVTDNGVAYAWSAQSGEELWKKRLGGNFSASPVLVGDKVFVPNLEGQTFVFRAGDRYDAIGTNRLGNDSYASIAVSSGDLFMRVGFGAGDSRRESIVCIRPEN